MALELSLTYDGTLYSHLETAYPQLQAAGLCGTFYADPVTLVECLRSWQEVAASGNEVGNGCLLSYALPDGSLPAWTPAMIMDEVEEVDFFLDDLFPLQPEHSLALPMGESICAEGQPYHERVARLFNVIRTGQRGLNAGTTGEFQSLLCLPMAGLDGDAMIQVVRMAMQQGGWAILQFAGVGTDAHAIDATAHRELVRFLRDSEDLVRVLPVTKTAEALREPIRTRLNLA